MIFAYKVFYAYIFREIFDKYKHFLWRVGASNLGNRQRWETCIYLGAGQKCRSDCFGGVGDKDVE